MRLWRHTALSTGDLTPAPPQGIQASRLGALFWPLVATLSDEHGWPRSLWAGHRWNRHLHFADRADLSDLRPVHRSSAVSNPAGGTEKFAAHMALLRDIQTIVPSTCHPLKLSSARRLADASWREHFSLGRPCCGHR
jgi:hypothetical protein